MEEALKNEGIGSPVMEVYSPSRVNGMAARLGITAGLSLDLTTHDPDDGWPWDFTKQDKRIKALRKVENKEALLLIGSPLCTVFSQLQTLNKNKKEPKETRERKERWKTTSGILHEAVQQTNRWWGILPS